MKFIESKLVEQGQGKWTVTIDGQEWQDILKKAKNRVKESLEIPGFRKGKAPESEVAKYLTPAKIYNEAFRLAVQPAFTFARENDVKIEPMNSPEPIPFKVNEELMVIDFVFDLRPEIKLGKYTGIETVVKEKPEVSQAEVDQVISQYQDKFVMEKTREKDEKIAKGDKVIFDFKGFVDGVAFPGGEAKNHTLIIGSNQFIPGFEDAMIGKTIGESSIEVTFPKEYTPELSGKDALFELEIKEIKERILPAKDDELVKDLNIPNVSSIKQLEEKIKNDILVQKTSSLKNKFVDEIMEEIIKGSEIDLPASAIKKQILDLKREFEEEVSRQGLTMKDYKKTTGLSDADIEKEMAVDAKFRLSSYLVTSEILEKEKFVPTPEQIETKYDEMAKRFGVEVSYVKSILSEAQVKNEMINEILIDFLYEKNGK